MSAPADHPRLAEKADTQNKIWKYYVADSKGKPVCKRCFESVMTKRANMSVSLCSMTVCQCETTLTLAADSEEAERSCTQTRYPSVAQVYKVPLIKRENALFLRTLYRGTFLISVYRATLAHLITAYRQKLSRPVRLGRIFRHAWTVLTWMLSGLIQTVWMTAQRLWCHTSYSFCEDCCIPSRTKVSYSDDKLWSTT